VGCGGAGVDAPSDPASNAAVDTQGTPSPVASLNLSTGQVIEFYDFKRAALIVETGEANMAPALNRKGATRPDELVDIWTRLAPEQAVPEAADVFTGAIKNMSFDDARSILTGTNNAATQYFRRTTETNLFDRFLPIVKKATDQTGVTAAYKQLMEKVEGADSFGGFGRTLLGGESVDLDGYVTHKALDGLFLMVADEEKKIRENPIARTTGLLQQVFGAITRQPQGQ